MPVVTSIDFKKNQTKIYEGFSFLGDQTKQFIDHLKNYFTPPGPGKIL